MKFLPILILVLLLVPVFVLAQYGLNLNFTGPHGEPRACSENQGICCYGYRQGIDYPCSPVIPSSPGEDSTKCYPYYCAQGTCKGLWDNGEYCSLKVCCALTKIQRFMFFIASGLAIIVIVWAGITYMVAGGGEEKVTKAKKTLLYGLIGAAIVFSSGFIINFLMEILY